MASEAESSRPAPAREPDPLAAGPRPSAGGDPGRRARAGRRARTRWRSPSSWASAAGRSARRSDGSLPRASSPCGRAAALSSRALSKEEFLELYQVREALEAMAVQARRAEAAARGHRRTPGADRRDGDACRTPMGRRVLRGERGVPRASSSTRRERAGSLSCTGSCSTRSAATGRGLWCCAATCSARSPSTRRSCGPRKRGDAETGRRTSMLASTSGCRSAGLKGQSDDGAGRGRAGRRACIEFGVNLNNREPLIAPDYDLPMLLDLSRRSRQAGFDSVWVGDSPLLEAALRADRAAVGDLPAHVAGAARHGLHGLLDAEPALSRARVGDARRDLGRPDDPRHRDGQPRGGRAARVRGARARLRPRAARSSRRGSRSSASSGPRAGRLPRPITSTTTASRSSPAPRWAR